MPASLSATPPQPADAPQSAFRAVWDEHREGISARVSLIERAVAALGNDGLDEQLRAEAQRSAHMLSGSLGMFGFTRAAQAAHELQLELAEAAPTRAPTLSTLAAIVRRGLGPEPHVDAEQPDARLRVLVVAANRELGARIAAAASARGIACETVSSSHAAHELCAQRAPAVVLLHLAARRQEQDDAHALLTELSAADPPTPVLVIADSSDFSDRVDAARGGSSAFLSKSLTADELLSAAEQLCDRGRLSATRVLAVDDDPAVLEVMHTLLQSHDLDVHTLSDPLRFWETLEELAPELLILDVDMPGINGLELCRTVRNDPRWSRIAVIFVAAAPSGDSLERVFEAGADDYLAKPIAGPELLARVANRLDRIRMFRAQAENDDLTGLSNRIACKEGLAQLAALSVRFREPLSVVMLDVDRFKLVNDRHGHAAGDSVLRRLGAYLRREFRGNDVVARWGGEEFVLGMYGITRADAARRLTEILARFRDEQFTGTAGTFHVSFSAGVAEYTLDGSDVDAVCQTADAALYRAKAAGRARVLEGSRARARADPERPAVSARRRRPAPRT